MFRVKSSDKKWSTMIELIAMMAIMALGIASMLGVIGSGIDFTKSTEDTIKAINLAREGIEWVTNWRDTNWLRFSSDRVNCWKIQNVPSYNADCIWTTSFSTNNSDSRNILSWSYLLYSHNGVWFLSGITSSPNWNSDWTGYKAMYRTALDTNGFFSQTGITATETCNSSKQNDCITIFTREIQVVVPSSTGSILVKSIVRWKGKRDQSVQLETTLTNWKSKF
jgi:type II secretory pathway pseudopilin PulG